MWSNCLAGWLLAGGRGWDRFVVLCGAATLLYLGGMFLNDAFDVEFDRKYRPERPIVSGRIRSRTVWLLGAAWLTIGWLAAVGLGGSSWVPGTVLVLAIVTYDACHKHFSLAPWPMAGCRFLVYLLAGTAARTGIGPAVVLPALALAVYVLGLSYIARVERTSGSLRRWPWSLLIAPAALSLLTHGESGALIWATVAMQTGWLCWCFTGRTVPSLRFFRTGVSGLLAGIALVDLVAAIPAGAPAIPPFVVLFLLALALQRFAPAT
ncbi:MAG TPA: UbiA family prenyltransferase [Verrucomicrobiae bacterium]